jgi:hypothetical protein
MNSKEIWCECRDANVVGSSPILGILMMGSIGSSKTSVLTRTTRRNIPEDSMFACSSSCFLSSYHCISIKFSSRNGTGRLCILSVSCVDDTKRLPAILTLVARCHLLNSYSAKSGHDCTIVKYDTDWIWKEIGLCCFYAWIWLEELSTFQKRQ